MDTWIAPRHGPSSSTHPRSRYERAWSRVAVLAAVVWIAVAVVQTPLLPLVALAVALGGFGGIFFVTTPAPFADRARQYLAGVLAIAGLVLVLVGFRHDLDAGLATTAVLAGSSPAVLRWIAAS